MQKALHRMSRSVRLPAHHHIGAQLGRRHTAREVVVGVAGPGCATLRPPNVAAPSSCNRVPHPHPNLHPPVPSADMRRVRAATDSLTSELGCDPGLEAVAQACGLSVE